MRPDAKHGSAAGHDTLPGRCDALGLPVWRVDLTGNILDEPAHGGVLGLWLRSSALADLMGRAIASIDHEAKPTMLELCGGAWLLPIPECRRRRRIGYRVALAMGREVLDTDAFTSSCRSVHVEEAVVRHTVARVATFTEAEAERIHRILLWMSDDQLRLEKDRTSIDGFAAQLSDAYETIHTLYAVGRSMCNLGEPLSFVEDLTRRLYENLDFGWVLCRMSNDARLPTILRGRSVSFGSHPCTEVEFENVMSEAIIESAQNPSEQPLLFAVREEMPEALGPQIIAMPIRTAKGVLGTLLAGSKGGPDPQVSSYETLLIEATSGYLTSFLENVILYADQRETFLGTVQALTAAIDAKDRYTRGHSERVAYLSAEIARSAGLGDEEVRMVHIAGLVHDIGKIGVSEAVLSKTGPLTDEEFDQIKMHPTIGHTILKDIPLLRDILPGVLHHHERWDGRGYPGGLATDSIPQMARIIGLADTFDAMSSNRSYRPAMRREQVLAEIEQCAGSQHDPALVPLLLKLDLAKYDAMVAAHATSEPLWSDGDGSGRSAA